MSISCWKAEWEEEREARAGPVVPCVGRVFHGGRLGGYWSDAGAQASWWPVMNDFVCLSSKDKFEKMTCSRSEKLLLPFDHIFTSYYLKTESTCFIVYSPMYQHRLLYITSFDFQMQLGLQLVVIIIYSYQTQPCPSWNSNCPTVVQWDSIIFLFFFNGGWSWTLLL